jgi:hypothetical protein
MFGNWLNGVDKKSKDRIRIGVSALCWSIWRCRNNIVFNNSTTFNIMQVIHMVVHWVQQWALLLPQDQRVFMDTGCNHLQTVAQDICPKLDDVTLVPDYMMLSSSSFSFLMFRWLIYVFTMRDP